VASTAHTFKKRLDKSWCSHMSAKAAIGGLRNECFAQDTSIDVLYITCACTYIHVISRTKCSMLHGHNNYVWQYVESCVDDLVAARLVRDEKCW